MDVDLSVVICTYNRPARARQTVDGVKRALDELPCRAEIVVVDDASPEPEPFAHDGATVFRHHRNLGVSATRNSGARVANGEWLLFLDDDMDVDAAALAALYRRRHPSHCIVPLIRDDGDLQNAVVSTWTKLDLKTTFSDEPLVEVAYPMGGGLLLHRDLFERAGGFDERIRPNYCEDDAFGADLHAVGASVLMAPDSNLGHQTHGGDASPEHERVIRRRLFHNRWVFLLTKLRGRRRATVALLGAPRTVHESVNTRSLEPVRGYLNALVRLPELLGDKPTIGPLAARGRLILSVSVSESDSDSDSGV
jgi:O-antigen biosynthesis protein